MNEWINHEVFVLTAKPLGKTSHRVNVTFNAIGLWIILIYHVSIFCETHHSLAFQYRKKKVYHNFYSASRWWIKASTKLYFGIAEKIMIQQANPMCIVLCIFRLSWCFPGWTTQGWTMVPSMTCTLTWWAGGWPWSPLCALWARQYTSSAKPG